MRASRRDLFKGALAVAPAFLYAQSERKYKTALIGTGWWGMNILGAAMESKTVSVVGMCDPDPNQLDPATTKVQQLTGDQPRKYRDFREMLAKEKPEIAIVATPDHWHPLATIEAVRAGAHVYVEKPISHTILEGQAMVKAARESDRVVQVGLHRRVSPHNVSGIDFLRSGKAGKIGMVRAFVHNASGPGKPTPETEPPAGMDWDLWCGPAPKRNFSKAIHPRGFRQFLEYANGTLGDWGVHWMDQILFWTEEKWPRRVHSAGGRFIKQDSANAPDTQTATYQFESFTAVWEHRQYSGNNAEKHGLGTYFYGTEGTFHMGWLDGWTFYPADKKRDIIHVEPQLQKPDDQNIPELWADFLRNIEARRRPVADIDIGRRATEMSLLGMLSLNLGRSVEWDGEKGQIVGDAEANKLLSRAYRAPWAYPKV